MGRYIYRSVGVLTIFGIYTLFYLILKIRFYSSKITASQKTSKKNNILIFWTFTDLILITGIGIIITNIEGIMRYFIGV
jgi:hypothetical protein